MTLALQGERLWSHCSKGTDPTDFAEFASKIPTPKDRNAITDAKREEILDWQAKDAQAKAFISRKMSVVIASLLSRTQTARQQWNILAQHYSRIDLLSQYELRSRVRSEKLKDEDDATRYIGVFEDARRRFLHMGVTYTVEESIFDLLQGLPEGVDWEIFREFMLNKLTQSSVTSSTTPSSSTSPKFTFEDATKLLAEKANAIVGRRKLAGPGSECVNVAVGAGKGGGKSKPTLGYAFTSIILRELNVPAQNAQASPVQTITTKIIATGQVAEWRTRHHLGFATGRKMRQPQQPFPPQLWHGRPDWDCQTWITKALKGWNSPTCMRLRLLVLANGNCRKGIPDMPCAVREELQTSSYNNDWNHANLRRLSRLGVNCHGTWNHLQSISPSPNPDLSVTHQGA